MNTKLDNQVHNYYWAGCQALQTGNLDHVRLMIAAIRWIAPTHLLAERLLADLQGLASALPDLPPAGRTTDRDAMR